MNKLVILILLVSAKLSAQDSIMYSTDFTFKEGIYLNYQQFVDNAPIAKSKVKMHLDSTRLDYLKQSMTQHTITYIDTAGKMQEVAVVRLWGYSENNAVYYNFNADFNRVIVIGSLCHFTATYTSYMTSDPTNPGSMNYGTPVTSSQQYVLDVQTGATVDFTLTNMEFYLKRDQELYAEFMALSKGKRRKLMFYYLRKYNERHPLYFPKN